MVDALNCLSRVRGNSHARFLEGKAVVIPLTYSTGPEIWHSEKGGSSARATRTPLPPRSMEKKPRQQDKVNPGLTDLFLKQARKVLQAPEELALIEQKMAQLGTVNREAYLRKMALDGYVVKLDLPELKELVSLMRYSSNNLNQLTRKVHETGRVYDADLEDISQRQEQLWEGVQKILAQLSKLS